MVAATGLLVYMLGYLAVGASEVERQAYRGLVATGLRQAEARLRRS